MARQPGGWPGAFLGFIAGAALHELPHAISLRRSHRKMGIVAQLDTPVSASAYRLGVATPVRLMALLPLAGGLATGAGLILLWGATFLVESVPDIASLLATRPVMP